MWQHHIAVRCIVGRVGQRRIIELRIPARPTLIGRFAAPQSTLQQGYCAESRAEDRDGKEDTDASCFDLYYCAHPKIDDEAYKKPKARCLRSVSNVSPPSRHKKLRLHTSEFLRLRLVQQVR
jgi:hypothetical protein